MSETTIPELEAEAALTAAVAGDTPSGGVSDEQMGGLKRESLLLTATYGLNALVGLAFWAVAARSVSISQLGANTAIISAFTFAAVVAATGMANAFLAMVPIAGRAQGQLLRYGYTLAMTGCLVTGAISGTIAVTVVNGIGHPIGIAVAITIASVVWGVFVIQDSVLVALGQARWLLYENFPVSIIKLALLPVLAVGLGKGSHPVVLATGLPALVAALIVSGVVLPRLVDKRARERDADPEADPTTAQEWMAGHRREFQLFALRDGAASAMNLGLFTFLPFLVTAASGFEQGAVFSLCLQISSAMDLFTVGVGISLTKTVASDHAAGPAAARMMWKRLALIVAGVAVLVIAFSPIVLHILGEQYVRHHGWEVVVILVVGSFLRTTFEVWTALLRALRRTGVLLAWTSLTAVTVFVSVIVGAHFDGAVGGALGVSGATVLASVIGGLGLLGRVRASDPVDHGPGDTRLRWPWLGLDPAPMEGVRESATWFGPEQRPHFGWLSLPEVGTATAGVIICPPVGEEARSSHRAFRRLGSELARRGMVALRVDYDGTGDSAGGQHDPDRVAAWQTSIRDAADELRAMGLTEVAVVGMRIGATLAAGVAAEGGYSSVVLWDPCANGRTFLREGAALQKLAGGHLVSNGEGWVETPGFAYAPETVEQLRAVSLSALPTTAWCDRLLTLTRTGKPLLGAAAKGLGGEHAEWGEASGQLELIGVEPNEARTPLPVVEHICDWLAEAVADRPAVEVTPQIRTEAVLEDPRSGRTIRERIVELGPNKLFGIVSEPLDPRADAPWIGLVNVAIELHIGPGRRWVEFARSWAALGIRCVRFDQSGLGDSPRRPEQREDTIFDKYWLQDVPDVITALDAGDAPVSLFGLCSGAYSAFEASMRSGVDAVYGVSARFSIPEFGRGEYAYSEDRLAGQPFIRPLARLFHRNTRAAWGLWRLYYQIAVWNAPMAAVHKVLRRGTTVRMLASRKDAEGYLESVWWSILRRRSITRTKRFALRVEPTLEHALMTQWSQDVTYDDATRFWLERYGTASTATR